MASDLNAPSPTSPVGRLSVLWLVLILALAAVVRVREAWLTPLWFDEIFSLWMTRAPFGTMLQRLAGDIHPPLMSVLVWLWRSAGGEHVLWLKSLPILIGLATVATLYFAARDWYGSRTALVAAALLALHGMHVYFSQEIRSYTLLILAVLLVTWTAWRWMRWGRTRDGLLYVASATLALYSHYLSGLVLMLVALWGALILREKPHRLMQWAGWHLAVTAAFLPQLPTFLHQIQLSSDHWMRRPVLEDLDSLVRKVAFGARYMVPALVLIALLPLVRRKARATSAMLWWVMVAPALTAFVLTYERHANLFVERYMYFVVPPFCALIAEGLVGTRYRRLAAVSAAAMIVFAGRQVLNRRPHVEAVALDQVVRKIEGELRPGDVVFCADSHSLFALEHRHPAADARLLMTWPRLPYYEGAAFITDSMRTSLAELERAARSGRRWWGLRTRHGGLASTEAAARMDSLARGGARDEEMVRVWAGQPGMFAGSSSRPQRTPGAPAAH